MRTLLFLTTLAISSSTYAIYPSRPYSVENTIQFAQPFSGAVFSINSICTATKLHVPNDPQHDYFLTAAHCIDPIINFSLSHFVPNEADKTHLQEIASSIDTHPPLLQEIEKFYSDQNENDVSLNDYPLVFQLYKNLETIPFLQNNDVFDFNTIIDTVIQWNFIKQNLNPTLTFSDYLSNYFDYSHSTLSSQNYQPNSFIPASAILDYQIHPNYDLENEVNDLAIFQTNHLFSHPGYTLLDFSQLPINQNPTTTNLQATAVGQSNFQPQPNFLIKPTTTLQAIHIPSLNACSKDDSIFLNADFHHNSDQLLDDNRPTGFVNNRDSGGPLLIKNSTENYKIIGVLSYSSFSHSHTEKDLTSYSTKSPSDQFCQKIFTTSDSSTINAFDSDVSLLDTCYGKSSFWIPIDAHFVSQALEALSKNNDIPHSPQYESSHHFQAAQ